MSNQHQQQTSQRQTSERQTMLRLVNINRFIQMHNAQLAGRATTNKQTAMVITTLKSVHQLDSSIIIMMNMDGVENVYLTIPTMI